MTKATKLRLVGGAILLFNLWLIGQFKISGIAVLLLTIGFAVGFEFLVVRPATALQKPVDVKDPASSSE